MCPGWTGDAAPLLNECARLVHLGLRVDNAEHAATLVHRLCAQVGDVRRARVESLHVHFSANVDDNVNTLMRPDVFANLQQVATNPNSSYASCVLKLHIRGHCGFASVNSIRALIMATVAHPRLQQLQVFTDGFMQPYMTKVNVRQLLQPIADYNVRQQLAAKHGGCRGATWRIRPHGRHYHYYDYFYKVDET